MSYTDVLTVRSHGLPMGPLESHQVNLWQGVEGFTLHGSTACVSLVGEPHLVSTTVAAAAQWGTCECANRRWPDSLDSYLGQVQELAQLIGAYHQLRFEHKQRRATTAAVLELAHRVDRLELRVARELAPQVRTLAAALEVLSAKVDRHEARLAA